MQAVKARYDVIVIGGGVAGASVVRELSKYKLTAAIFEKEAEVCFGQTKGTHGIIHSGLPGISSLTPMKNRGELKGNLMMEQLCKDLDVPYEKIGKLLVAFDKEELEYLKKYEFKAKRNGVPGVELITDTQRIRQMEPNLSDKVIAALYTPNTGIVSPWGLVYGLIENAMDNGAELFVEAEVRAISVMENGDFLIETTNGRYQSSYIVNAAGLNADKIANMIGDYSFNMKGTRQQRIIMDKKVEGIVKHLVRGVKATGGLGDFVCPTVYGDVMVGCKVENVSEIGDTRTTREGLEDWVIPRYMRLVPSLSPAMGIRPFAGFIPKEGTDYYVKPSDVNGRFIHMVLGSSGITASPAMGEYVVQELLARAGLELEAKQDFNSYRKDIPHIHDLTDEGKAELVAKNPLYGHIVCRCETVSEGEMVEAIRRGARTRDGIKYRTRSGMGRCQGGFCGPRVLKILSRELGMPMEQITRKGGNSVEVPYKAKELLKKKARGGSW